MSRRRAPLAIAALVSILAPTASAGNRRAPPVRIVASLPAADAKQTVLVGASGQLYRTDGETLRWRRDTLGGVAAPVRGAVAAGDTVYAVGPRSPVYRFGGESWQVQPLANRGATRVGGPGSTPVLAVGRHVYTVRAARWKRLTTAPRPIAALWAEGTAEVYAADDAGGLRWYRRGRWLSVKLQLPAGDAVAQLAGDKQGVVARSRSGVVARVKNGNATTLAPSPALASFGPQLLGAAGRGEAWVVGVSAPATGAPRVVLARTDKNRLALVEALPPLAANDRFTVARSYKGGALLLATRLGAVHVRSAAGVWTRGTVSGELPPSAIRTFDAAPARSR